MYGDPSKAEIEAYWERIIRENTENRQNMRDTKNRLVDVLLSFYYQEGMYDVSTRRSSRMRTLADFWGSKRPYGNKDVARSIMYRTGWDREGYAQYAYFPTFVEELCMELHNQVFEDLAFAQEQIDEDAARFRADTDLLFNLID